MSYVETFTEVSNVSLVDHTSDNGSTYALHTDSGGSMTIVAATGRVRGDAAATTRMLSSYAPPSADVTVDATLVYVSATGHTITRIAVRMDPNNHTMVIAGFVPGASPVWDIFEVVNGTYTERDAQTGPAFSVGQTKRIRLTVTATSAKLYVDGVLVCTGTLATVTGNGRFGIRINGAAGVDNSNGIHISDITEIVSPDANDAVSKSSRLAVLCG